MIEEIQLIAASNRFGITDHPVLLQMPVRWHHNKPRAYLCNLYVADDTNNTPTVMLVAGQRNTRCLGTKTKNNV